MAEQCGGRHLVTTQFGPEEPHPFTLPGATDHYAAERAVRVRHVKLEVALDFATSRVSGRCETDLEAVRQISAVSFDAIDLEVTEVRVDGKKVGFGNSGRHLHVQLLSPLEPGEVATVAIRYSAQPTRGLYFLKPDDAYRERPVQAWTQGQDEDSRCWFPCLDAPAQKATTELLATFPATFTALSNGKKISDVVRGKNRTVHYRLEVPHSPYLVTLAVGEFEEATARAGKVQLRYLFAKGQKADALRVLGRTPQMVKRFEELTGRAYPFGSYSQIFVTEFIFGGMENTSATTLTDVVLHDERVHEEYRAAAESLIAHELAHQWFGDLLTCRDWPHGWLNEGFATYFETLWKEFADGNDEADHGRRDDLGMYLEEASSRYARPIVARKFHEPIDLFDRHLYEKGGLVLHELRRRLGDAPFFRALARYVEDNAEGSVETVDLARAIERSSGHNFDRFFDQYVFSRGHPQLKADVSFDAAEKVLKIKVRQTQKTTGDLAVPLFELPLDVVVVFGAREQRERLTVKDVEHTFLLPCEREPTQVRVDERREVLGTLNVTKGAQLWMTELSKAPFARSRTEAAVALGKDGSNRAVAALGQRLAKEPFWGTGAAIAKALGQIRTEGAKKALLENISLPNPKVRRAVIAALGEFKRDAEIAQALRALLDHGDESPFVEGETARSLGKLKVEGVLPVLERLLQRKSFQDVVAAGAIDGLVETQSKEAFDLIEPLTRYGQRQFIRRAATLALGKLAEPAERKARAVEVLTELLRDKQFRVQMVAFDAVVTLGDRRAISALETIPFLDGRARRAAREALRSLREGAPQAKEVSALREELDKLKEETRGMKERLEALTLKTSIRAARGGKK